MVKARVFSRNHVVLVSESPIQEISIHRGLKQGDLLAPFLFLLVAEGISGFTMRANELEIYSGFRDGTFRLVMSHL